SPFFSSSFFIILPPPTSTLFPYTTLFRSSRGRYRMHDLISEHAQALAATEPAVYRDAAVDRLLEYYLQTARAASHLVRRTHDKQDRKSTRLNSSHVAISYAVFCLKKKKNS